MAKEEKNIHEGHRERLLETVLNCGLENVSPIVAVEYFLTYIFPRGDVNPLAHRLLDAFTNFAHIVEADVADLMTIKGINERSAKKIHMFCDLFHFYIESRMTKGIVINSRGEAYDLVEDLLRSRNEENLFLIALSRSGRVLRKKRFQSKSDVSVNISVLDLTAFLSSVKPNALIVAHCHPFGKATPSRADDESYCVIEKVCKTCGVDFLDSIIVGEDGAYSQKEEQYVRKFDDSRKVMNAFKKLVASEE